MNPLRYPRPSTLSLLLAVLLASCAQLSPVPIPTTSPQAMTYTVEDLGTLPGGNFSIAYGVSADGNTVVGGSDNADGQRRAFSYSTVTDTMTDLGTLGGSFSEALGVSADGNTAVGYSNNAAGEVRATRWTVTVTREPQTIKFDVSDIMKSDIMKTVGDAPFSVADRASASSSLPVNFTTQTPTTCTVTPEGTVTVVAAGTCTLTASQPGNADFEPATPVDSSFTISAAAPVAMDDMYLIDFETAPANRLVYSVKLGSGVVYLGGDGTPSQGTIPVVGKRRLNGRILPGHQAKVVTLYGSKRLTVTSLNTNTPAPQGGRLKLSFAPNINPEGVTLTSLTLSNLPATGAYPTFYKIDGTSSRQNVAGTGVPGSSVVVPANAMMVRAVDIFAPNAYAVDDVAFTDEVGTQ